MASLSEPTGIKCIPNRFVIVLAGVVVKLLSYLVIGEVVEIGRSNLYQALDVGRRPIITVSNHISYLDDPFVWASLPWRYILSKSRMRWSLGAQEICFCIGICAWVLSRCQVIPIVRGLGIYQYGMNISVDLIRSNAWVHLFSEGKINVENDEILPFRWGVGRLIMEADVKPIVVPIYHKGLDDVLPTRDIPCLPNMNKSVYLSYGKSIDFQDPTILEQTKNMDDDMQRSYYAEYIRARLIRLRRRSLAVMKIRGILR